MGCKNLEKIETVVLEKSAAQWIRNGSCCQIVEKGNTKKSAKVRPPGPEVKIGKSIAKEIRTIGLLVLEKSTAQWIRNGSWCQICRKRKYQEISESETARPCSEDRRVDCKRDQDDWAIGSRDMTLTNFARETAPILCLFMFWQVFRK